jgi:hypothetical protein
MTKARRTEFIVSWDEIPQALLGEVFSFLQPGEHDVCGVVSRSWTALFRKITWPHRLKVVGSFKFRKPTLTRDGPLARLRVPKFEDERPKASFSQRRLVWRDGELKVGRAEPASKVSRVQCAKQLRGMTRTLQYVRELVLDNLDCDLDQFLELPALCALTVRRCTRLSETCASLRSFPRLLASLKLIDCQPGESLGRLMHTAPLCAVSLGVWVNVQDAVGLLALPTLQEASLTVYDMDDPRIKSVPPKLTIVWNSWRHGSLTFNEPYSSVRDLTLHVRLHKHPDFRPWKALRRLTLINGTVELKHFPPSLEVLTLHGVAVVAMDDNSYFSDNERCSRAETVVLRHSRLEARTFNKMFDGVRRLTIADADAFTVSELVRALGRASDRASEKLPRVLDQVTLMRPFPRFTKRLLGALAKLKQLVLVEPQELSADERLLAVRAASCVALRGVRTRDRPSWTALNPQVTFQ